MAKKIFLALALATAFSQNVFALPAIGHDSLNSFYRYPFGAVSTQQDKVTLRIVLESNAARAVNIQLSDFAERRTFTLAMRAERRETGRTSWRADVPVPKHPTLLNYTFEIVPSDPRAPKHYLSQSESLQSPEQGEAPLSHGFRITVYEPGFKTPDWFKEAVIYQIFPDRFRNGNLSNDPASGIGEVYGRPVRKLDWTQNLCDPRGPECPKEFDNQFYGGDLNGVLSKIDEIKSLGVTALYLNPIFDSVSNHHYDTRDYKKIDERLGDMEVFRQLVSAARARGIRIILDGVFNHVSADSPYFDIFDRHPDQGACHGAQSPYRDWFFFKRASPSPTGQVYVGPCLGDYYQGWNGFNTLPELDLRTPSLRNFLFASGPDAVGPYWVGQGISGWRLDAGVDADPGLLVDPTMGFWRAFKQAMQKANPETVLIGEEWRDPVPLLLGGEWDSAMNYQMQAALLNWMSDGCSGEGCHADGAYINEERNEKSPLGALRPMSETQLLTRLRRIQEDYPPEAWMSLLTVIGSHDTERVLAILRKTSSGSTELAIRKLKLLTWFEMTYPGTPLIYYGDEVGMDSLSHFDGERWQGDPYNRAPYPWPDLGMSPNLDLRAHFARATYVHNTHSVFKAGGYQPLFADDARRLLAYRRFKGNEQAWVILSRNPQAQQLTIQAHGLREGTQFIDAVDGGHYVVRGGSIDLGTLEPFSARILTLQR